MSFLKLFDRITSFVHPSPTYPLGLALSGGGARGFAHIGALKALEEKGLRPDIISGTSAGAIVGALYCAGFKPDEMMELFSHHNAKDFLSLTLPKKSFFKYDGFCKFLHGCIPTMNIEDLELPLYITASNFDTGECVVFKEGELVPRVMASCTIPVVFEPLKIEGVRYVDGGLFKNLPVSPIRPLCKKIIGVSVNPYLTDEHKDNMLYIAFKSYQYMFNANTVGDKRLCDLLLEIDDVNKYNMFDIDKGRALYELGYRNMLALLDSQWATIRKW